MDSFYTIWHRIKRMFKKPDIEKPLEYELVDEKNRIYQVYYYDRRGVRQKGARVMVVWLGCQDKNIGDENG
jgi:hypothetical protein